MAGQDVQFIVLVPTFKRAKLLLRAVGSVERQTYPHWRLVVMNDSPDDPAYAEIAAHIAASPATGKIRLVKNAGNIGKNASMNAALASISDENKENTFVLFLDDDDWLDEQTLARAAAEIRAHRDVSWFVSNRTMQNTGTSLTRVRRMQARFSYRTDYLLSRAISGDATHVIRLDAAKAAAFPRSVRNGEEWFYFAQIRPNSFRYYDYPSTRTETYSPAGLTAHMNASVRMKNTWRLFIEALGMPRISPLCHLTILVYLIGRIMKTAGKMLGGR